jgi:glucan biosynthesis protein C
MAALCFYSFCIFIKMINEKRIYGIDALRAIAMLLGIVLHASIAYKANHHRNWIHDEQFNHPSFDLLYFFIHSFRMPVFFLIAGFFCRLLYYKIGEKQFVIHRWKRVAIPFIAGVLLIVPVSLIPYDIYFNRYIMKWEPGKAISTSLSNIVHFRGLAHLWFLYDLLLFYACMLVIMRLARTGIVKKAFTAFDKWLLGLSFNSALWIVLVSIPVFLALLPDQELFVITDTYLIPRRITNLVFYGYLFVIGWCMHKRMDVFELLNKKFPVLIVAGMVLCGVLFYAEFNGLLHNQWLHALAKLGAALQVILLTMGSIGFFLHYFKSESWFWKYVSDSSYWIYLVHLGLVTGLQLYFLNSGMPGILRFPLVLLIPLILTIATYQWFVRYTFIGNILHGPRKRKK